MIFQDFIGDVLNETRRLVRSYAGGMFVDAVYNRQGDMISVIWARYPDGQSETYNFPVIDGSDYTEMMNNGQDFSAYRQQLIDTIYMHMVKVESEQTGRAPAI
ncbi:protein of unknown function [Enterobacter cancerogenus]|uniref:hypothetical protein n=1 Tax=Enterobacter cancerogenus TaxID=69218 RepID=UPI0019292AA0|nr:hypothetical protein [Enterobacter cancerogenus]CAD5354814.1 protein of unknown function [Enterobacter cancerogenus]